MPNHCENDLEVSGKKEDIERFLEHCKTDYGDIDYNQFISHPAQFKELDKIAENWVAEHGTHVNAPKDGYNQGGHEWCNNNWGTKWNAYSISIDPMNCWEKECDIMLHFDSAWSPPHKVVEAMAGKFPELRFRHTFFEQGSQFNGETILEDGEVTSHETGAYFGSRGG